MTDVINVLVNPEKIPLIEVKNFLDWPEEIRVYLRDNLTILKDPEYNDYLSGMRRETKNNNPITCVAFIDNTPVGWGLFAKKYLEYFNVVMVYVDKKYRRKGIGKSLVKIINNLTNNICCGVAWNEESGGFYNSINEVHIIRVENE